MACPSAVYIDYLKRISGVLMAGRPVLVFGTGFQSGLAKKRLSERYLRMLCKGKLLGGVRGPETKGVAQGGCVTLGFTREMKLGKGRLVSLRGAQIIGFSI